MTDTLQERLMVFYKTRSVSHCKLFGAEMHSFDYEDIKRAADALDAKDAEIELLRSAIDAKTILDCNKALEASNA